VTDATGGGGGRAPRFLGEAPGWKKDQTQRGILLSPAQMRKPGRNEKSVKSSHAA
jgi:hypothetical protein